MVNGGARPERAGPRELCRARFRAARFSPCRTSRRCVRSRAPRNGPAAKTSAREGRRRRATRDTTLRSIRSRRRARAVATSPRFRVRATNRAGETALRVRHRPSRRGTRTASPGGHEAFGHFGSRARRRFIGPRKFQPVVTSSPSINRSARAASWPMTAEHVLPRPRRSGNAARDRDRPKAHARCRG